VEVFAARFPTADEAFQPATFSMAGVIPGEPVDTFDLSALSGMAAVEPQWPSSGEIASEPAARPQRPMARSPNVLNDAQIASIRRRLRLTIDQERLWPAVEVALRKIVYTRAAMNAGRSGSTAYIDPASAEVRELKSAALPLLMRLSDEQKREVKMLAYVMGLEAVASQF
jgi:hypothetical protein